MKDAVLRETVIAIGGLILISAVYLFGVFLPERRNCKLLREEIVAAESALNTFPVKVAEMEALTRSLRKRTEYLERTAPLFPANPDVHRVVHEVSALGHRTELEVTRLEPLEVVKFESHHAFPFRLSLKGSFTGLVQFLQGLEQQSRFFQIDQMKLTQEKGRQGGIVAADITFYVYAKFDDFSDFSRKEVILPQSSADSKR